MQPSAFKVHCANYKLLYIIGVLAASTAAAVTIAVFGWLRHSTRQEIYNIPNIDDLDDALIAKPGWQAKLRSGRDQLRVLINDTDRLQGHIRTLTKTSSLAGSPASMHQVEFVENFWRDLGLRVARRTYEVPVSYFNVTAEQPQPSIAICRRTAKLAEPWCDNLELDKPLTKEDTGIGGLSRAHYGFTRPLSGDFGLLRLSDLNNRNSKAGNLSDKLKGRLVLLMPNETGIIKMLMTLIGNMSSGVLIAHGLKETPPTTAPENSSASVEVAFPNGTGLPDTAVTFYLSQTYKTAGDPTTPGMPSKPYAVRREPPGGRWEPNATVVPVSQADARRLLEAFPSPPPVDADNEIFLRVHWPLQFGYRPVHDTCAEMPGQGEPDRAVLLAGHRDAWFGGAIDPHTGVATLLETGRALVQLANSTGWRPRRTVLMCTWDAKELGLFGSIEWVEDEFLRAGARIVAYFNTDMDVMGNWKILVQASDQMVDVVRNVMSELPNPTSNLTGLAPTEPYFFFWQLDETSDYFSFTRALGVPACDLSYIRGHKETLVLYDLYHTRYETLQLYRMMDPGGLAHLGLTRSVAALVYTFAQSPLLPLNMTAFGEGIRRRLKNLYHSRDIATRVKESAKYSKTMWRLLDLMPKAMDGATKALSGFQDRLDVAATLRLEPLEQRMLNDKMALVQKAFTHHCAFGPCHEAGGGSDSSVNLLNSVGLKDAAKSEKVLESFMFSLNSVPKILSDSFIDD